MAEKKCWTSKDIFSLISRWELLPELWDVKSKQYRNRVRKQNALQKLSIEYNTSEKEINRKLHNLRTQYNHELRKSRKKRSDNGDEDVNQSNWEFYRSLLFLRVHPSRTRTMDKLVSVEVEKLNH